MKAEIVDYFETEESNKFVQVLERTVSFAGKEELNRDDYEVCVYLTDGETVRSINAEQRGIDSETDVLSFPLWDRNGGEEPFVNPETGNIMLGDIIISLPRLKEQAEEYGHSETREAAYLCIHGMLHLMGYDHMEEDEKKIMREKEETMLKKLNYTRED